MSHRRQALHTQPIVVHVAPDGTYRYVGDPNVAVKPGFVKKEMNYYEARKFCREVNEGQRADLSRHLSNLQKAEESVNKEARTEILRAMRDMTPRGREFAEYAIAESNRRDAERYRSWDTGFHIEGLE